MFALFLTLISAGQAAEIAPPEVAIVSIEGMDCGGCNGKVAKSLGASPGVSAVFANFAAKGACLELAGTIDEDDLATRLKDDTGYVVTGVVGAERCPRDLRPSKTDPWADSGELDAQVISTGDKVKLSSILVAEKFTIVDFGAPWCGPCLVSAAAFKSYLGDNADVAVRAIWLGGDAPAESFALPVAMQHLQFVAGLPWFIVYSPAGKAIYKGQDHDEALAAIGNSR